MTPARWIAALGFALAFVLAASALRERGLEQQLNTWASVDATVDRAWVERRGFSPRWPMPRSVALAELRWTVAGTSHAGTIEIETASPFAAVDLLNMDRVATLAVDPKTPSRARLISPDGSELEPTPLGLIALFLGALSLALLALPAQGEAEPPKRQSQR